MIQKRGVDGWVEGCEKKKDVEGRKQEQETKDDDYDHDSDGYNE